jgi:diguanylate cyclase (GGDEF)-like protein
VLRNIKRGFWPPVDPELVDAGRDGELAIARARVAIVALLAINPATALLIQNAGSAGPALALVVESLFAGAAVAILRLARRHPQVPWLGFATVFSGAFPQIALSSRVAFALYLLAILATSLRNDGRVATFAGLLAAFEWMMIVQAFSVDRMGLLDEVVIIVAATLLARIIASRARGLRLSSIRDNLTGLLTRTHFEERLAVEVMRSSRTRRPLALAIIDVDQFKRVNDTAGPDAGDEVLREVAARLTRSMRRTDLCARFGGDEFALAFIDTSVADAATKLDEIRRTVSATPIPLRVRAVVTVTCSAGVAIAPLDGQDAMALILIADTRLLAAKNAGRDRLMVAG